MPFAHRIRPEEKTIMPSENMSTETATVIADLADEVDELISLLQSHGIGPIDCPVLETHAKSIGIARTVRPPATSAREVK